MSSGKGFELLSDTFDVIQSYNGTGLVDVVIIPPTLKDDTDEDEDCEVLKNSILPKDVAGSVEVFYNDDDFDSEDDVPLIEIKKKENCCRLFT